ncbi:HlyD family efflux transporter periplasmic adaptor subunit [Fulvivirga maritima]|uniref:efflux RND transporter periplasmic adaptor subunit n=1 Tax=Fulvivirga maritima TaxID=2904247 RepID=UPI001F44AFEC|nr:HlyD family efflux transporter periplasmic adaptor subunit [Fulvivirga maritima]UII24511.1 HlyD family efflux transporter periplasmic adaptor subunit [Fulvivirga maritima]
MKKILIIGGAIVALLIVYFLVFGEGSATDSQLMATVERGDFEVKIITTGELEAKNSVEILGPSGLRNFGIFQVNIQSIAEEGTEVKKGAWIATLDPSELRGRITDVQADLDTRESEYTQMKLDTTLEMRQARDELINLKYDVEEKKIVLEQSQYEPPATIKQAQISVDKSKRAYDQAKENYKIKLKQNATKMRISAGKLNKAKRELDDLLELSNAFQIKAPEDGMLIYRKGWDGKPIKEGSQISAWDPVVATLPDLSVMLSKTYVNEVDVRKVKVGQKVQIGLDAFPEKELTGKVISIANVGEQKPNSDAKVFQVNVEIDGYDPLLLPSMTTSNTIITKHVPEVLHFPLESLHNQDDSITYVYKKEGLNIVKQEVQVGETNTTDAMILAGLEEGDRIYISVPGSEEGEVQLLPELNGKRNKPEAEDITEGKAQHNGSNPRGK